MFVNINLIYYQREKLLSYFGLSFESSPEKQLIEAAYKALVKLYHPDVYKGDKKSLSQNP